MYRIFLAFGFAPPSTLEARGSRREPRERRMVAANRGWPSERPLVGWGGLRGRARKASCMRFRNGKANHGKKRMTTLSVSALF